jgi:hypothetical protein
MLNLVRDDWHGAADIVNTLTAGAIDALVTLHAAMAALPLPFAVMTVAAGVALFHTIDQRAQRRDRNQ